MHALTLTRLLAVSVVLASGAAASAATPEELESPPALTVPPEPEAKLAGLGDHIEVATGFITGSRNYRTITFGLEGAEDPLPSTSSGRFRQYPYDGVLVSGVRWDLRAVVTHVRMGVGFGLPFAAVDSGRASGEVDVGGVTRQVAVQTLQPYELRFGLGGEYAFGRVALFADLLGEVHWLRTSLVVDGQRADYGVTAFRFAASAGARVALKGGFFLTATGEVGILGDVVWGAQLGAGYAFDT
ncbi:MAG: hypothetical protein QM765_17740 [Myxococcales bacterium]